MDFRRRSVIRIDRLRSRLESHIPKFLSGALTAEIQSLFDRSRDKLEFMRAMDAFQPKLYAQLVARYRDEPFCQLFTLKLCNLAIARYHFANRHSVLMSKPFQLTVDPANACQLACPACVHTSNRSYASQFDWPASMLPLDAYDRFLQQTGPFAFCASLYNYGEPLLHKRFADFVRSSKRYLLFTTTSTNLSMPLNDIDGIVESGLDRMILSIDGTTQDAYERYRRKGNLELVFENVRRLVASKRKMRSPTPFLVWQFLTFEHNAHQTNDAIRMASELGVDELLIYTPFDVVIDDPEIHAVSVPQRGSYRFSKWTGDWCSEARRKTVQDIAQSVTDLFNCSWEERFHSTSGSSEANRPDSSTCDWLYHNITIDGAARIMPCCMAPDKSAKHLVFDRLSQPSAEHADLVNSPMAKLARLSFADRGQYETAARQLPSESLPYCAGCSEKPMPYGLANVAADIRALDEKRVLPRALRWSLTNW